MLTEQLRDWFFQTGKKVGELAQSASWDDQQGGLQLWAVAHEQMARQGLAGEEHEARQAFVAGMEAAVSAAAPA